MAWDPGRPARAGRRGGAADPHPDHRRGGKRRGSMRRRCGPGRPRSRGTVHGAFTERYSAFWLGTRPPGLQMEDAGILPGFAGIVVSDRYQESLPPQVGAHRREQGIRGSHPARLPGLRRGIPRDAVWPVQAQRALRGLIRAWHTAREQGLEAIPAGVRKPLGARVRHAVLGGLASVPRVPGPKNSTKQRPGRELGEFCRDRRSDVLLFAEDTSISSPRITSASAAYAP